MICFLDGRSRPLARQRLAPSNVEIYLQAPFRIFNQFGVICGPPPPFFILLTFLLTLLGA